MFVLSTFSLLDEGVLEYVSLIDRNGIFVFLLGTSYQNGVSTDVDLSRIFKQFVIFVFGIVQTDLVSSNFPWHLS